MIEIQILTSIMKYLQGIYVASMITAIATGVLVILYAVKMIREDL